MKILKNAREIAKKINSRSPFRIYLGRQTEPRRDRDADHNSTRVGCVKMARDMVSLRQLLEHLVYL